MKKISVLFLMATLALTVSVAVSASAQSNTIPVLHINTEDGKPITSKTVYVNGSYYIDHAGEYNLGTAESPLTLQIRGRGNSSWKSEKKPYKLKLTEKTKLLGMKKNKHWALIKDFQKSMAGFRLGNIFGMDWTPSARPVEVVLNGDYVGFYILVETIRTDKNRVAIEEQPDLCTNPDSLAGGWLVEIDNYSDEHQMIVPECPQFRMRITWHTPEELSPMQQDWLRNEFTQMNADIYSTNKDEALLESHIDLDAMARFFIVQELMDNPDGFHGSFYLHRPYGEDSRWTAGPLWDLQCLEREKTDYTFRMKASYGFTPHWIGELLKYENFREAVVRAWDDFYPSRVHELFDYIDEACSPDIYTEADEANNLRWPSNSHKSLSVSVANTKAALQRNIDWFNNHLPQTTNIVESVNENIHPATGIYNLQGQRLSEEPERGIYIINGKKMIKKQPPLRLQTGVLLVASLGKSGKAERSQTTARRYRRHLIGLIADNK